MIYHASSVVRAKEYCCCRSSIWNLSNSKVALKSAIRIMKESGAHAAEGGKLVKIQ